VTDEPPLPVPDGRQRLRKLRGEAYNISNMPHFSSPAANVSSGGFMTITSTLSRSNNTEGGERQFRVAMKISF
jgi:hypothetical protein